jgi:hypothetical protein
MHPRSERVLTEHSYDISVPEGRPPPQATPLPLRAMYPRWNRLAARAASARILTEHICI